MNRVGPACQVRVFQFAVGLFQLPPDLAEACMHAPASSPRHARARPLAAIDRMPDEMVAFRARL